MISCLSEFGCETLGITYCLPDLLRRNPGRYTIVVGWYGREYLYRHLVDEFWEMKEEHQWLREYCRAFHHDSKNLTKIEESLKPFGKTIQSHELGNIAVGNRCKKCKMFWGEIKPVKKCPRCSHMDIEGSVLGNIDEWKPKMIPLPRPSEDKIQEVQKYLKPNPVGIFARGRVTYGRNLSPEFYVKLIDLLERMGYNPIWLGEKVSTQPCPVDHVVDFSRMEESRDLETTLAIICNLKFTVQFWTASTRFASMMNVPYLLFESPDQIWGKGQEGFRRNLCDLGPSKLAVNHFLNVYQDVDGGIKVVKQCIKEMEEGNYEDVFGLLETDWIAQHMKETNKDRIGSKEE